MWWGDDGLFFVNVSFWLMKNQRNNWSNPERPAEAAEEAEEAEEEGMDYYFGDVVRLFDVLGGWK